MTRHLPDVPWWRERAARIWVSFFKPRRMSSGARLAVTALVLVGIGNSAYTRSYVDHRVKARAVQNCASWGADELSADRDRILYELLLEQPRRPGDGAFRKYLADSQTAKTQVRDTKVELRRKNSCPAYPPPPQIPAVPSSR